MIWREHVRYSDIKGTRSVQWYEGNTFSTVIWREHVQYSDMKGTRTVQWYEGNTFSTVQWYEGNTFITVQWYEGNTFSTVIWRGHVQYSDMKGTRTVQLYEGNTFSAAQLYERNTYCTVISWPYTTLARTYLRTASTLECSQTLDPFTVMHTYTDLCLAHPLETWTPFDIVVNSAYALLTMPVTYKPTNVINSPFIMYSGTSA